jgi:hypothetical protein
MPILEGSRAYFEANNYSVKGGLRYVANNRVACEPIKFTAAELVGTSFKVSKQKIEMLKVRVVWGNERYAPNSFVYVQGTIKTLPWVNEIYELDGLKFILVPESVIQMVDSANCGSTSSTVP